MSDELMSMRGISVRFGGIRALWDLSFAVRSGELLGVIGPNGAGKTTLFHVMSGVIRPTEGEVRFEGHALAGRLAHVFNRAGVARTFQTPRVFRDMSVLENVRFGLRFSWRRGGRPTDRAAEEAALLRRLGLSDSVGALAGDLPQSRQRRLEIAMALATNPKLLLLDEVAAGLTQAEVEEIAALILAIRRERDLAVVWIEHNVATLMRSVDRVMVLHHGELLADGAPHAVARDPRVIDAYLGTEAAG
jgi:branched-chain amino acid transport system ATP-binding protein